MRYLWLYLCLCLLFTVVFTTEKQEINQKFENDIIKHFMENLNDDLKCITLNYMSPEDVDFIFNNFSNLEKLHKKCLRFQMRKYGNLVIEYLPAMGQSLK